MTEPGRKAAATVRAGSAPRALGERAPDIETAFSRKMVDPTQAFAELRAHCPVALQGGRGANGQSRPGWLLTRYADIVDAANSPVIFGQSIRWPERRRPPFESNPPEHRAMRRLLQPFFMPKHVRTLAAETRAMAVERLAPMITARQGDVAHGIARPLPPRVAMLFLGQPREDWEQVKHCSEAAYLQSSEDPAEQEIYRQANEWLWDYARDMIEDRKAVPRDPASDLVSALLAARIDGEPVAELLIAGMLRLLLSVAHDSTTTAMGACFRRLAEDSALQGRLRVEPALIPRAIDEILRLHAPVIQLPRTVMQDTELHGQHLCAGDTVLLAFASGNLDERVFPDAASLSLDRISNPHLSFGTGIHTCLGNVFARQEIGIVLEELLAHTRTFAMAAPAEHEYWHPNGLISLILDMVPA